jgi:aminopeptidase N
MMVAPIPGTFGQGFPGLVYLSTLAYLDPGERPAGVRDERLQVFFDEILHSHESAHQWWGNVVTTKGIQDDWLLEALANYSALLYIEKRKGSKAMMQILDQYRDRLLHEENGAAMDTAGPIRLGARLQNSLVPGAWRDIVYGKGSWIMHMLRKRMGDAAFLKMLGDICREKRYETITLREFQEYAAKAMPLKVPDRNLEAFFDHWVDNTGIPTFTMTTAVKGRVPNVQLTVTVKQSGVDPRAAFQVPVEVQPVRGKSQMHWVTTGEEPAVLALKLAAAPAKVTLDPESNVLATKQ